MASSLHPKNTILEESDLVRVIRRMAGQVVETTGGTDGLMLVGVRTRGVPLAERLAAEIERSEGVAVPVGTLDITLYRDDLSTIAPQPVVRGTSFPQPIDGLTLFLCDDVLYTGRTVRAALDALIDYGRPRAVRLAVLVDRGHRELPIQADVVGRMVPTSRDEVIEVRFDATDEVDDVRIMTRPEA